MKTVLSVHNTPVIYSMKNNFAGGVGDPRGSYYAAEPRKSELSDNISKLKYRQSPRSLEPRSHSSAFEGIYCEQMSGIKYKSSVQG